MPPRHLLLPSLLFLAALSLRLVHLDHASFWLDEILQTDCATQPLTAIWRCFPPDKPPLDYYLQWPFMQLGHTEFLARLHATLIGSAFVVAMAAWGQVTGGRRLAVIAAGLAFALPMAVRYSQEVRPYALLLTSEALFLALVTRVLWHRRPPRRAHWYGLAAAMGLHLWSLFMAWQTVAAAGLFVILWRLAGGRRSNAAALFPRFAQRAGLLTLFALGFASALIPVARAGNYVRPASLPWDVEVPLERAAQYLGILAGGYEYWQFDPTMAFVLALPLVAGMGAVFGRDRCRRAVAGFCSLAGIGIFVGAFVFAWSIDHWMEVRYTLAALPPLMMLVALGLEKLALAAAALVPRRRAGRVAFRVAIALALAVALRNGWWVLANPMERTDWRGAARLLKAEGATGPIILPADVHTRALEYYLQREGVAGRPITLSMLANPLEDVRRASPPAWIITGAGSDPTTTTGDRHYRLAARLGWRPQVLTHLTLWRTDDPAALPPSVLPELQPTLLGAERRSFAIDVSQPGPLPNIGRGWYATERWPDGTVVLPAAGGEGDLLVALAEPMAVRLRFSLISFDISRDPPRTIAFEVNGAPATTLDLREQWQWIDLLLPASHFRGGTNRITLKANRFYRPSELGTNPGDQRELSFYVTKIEVAGEQQGSE